MALALFSKSYKEFASYPENLVHKNTYIGGLRSYKRHLDEVQNELFTSKDANINVPFRDLAPSEDSMAPHSIYIEGHTDLSQHLRSKRCAMTKSSRSGSETTHHPTQLD